MTSSATRVDQRAIRSEWRRIHDAVQQWRGVSDDVDPDLPYVLMTQDEWAEEYGDGSAPTAEDMYDGGEDLRPDSLVLVDTDRADCWAVNSVEELRSLVFVGCAEGNRAPAEADPDWEPCDPYCTLSVADVCDGCGSCSDHCTCRRPRPRRSA